MLYLLNPQLNEIVTRFESILISVVMESTWPDLSDSPLVFQPLGNFLRHFSKTDFLEPLLSLYNGPVLECRSKTVLLLSIMKRAILEETYLFVLNEKGERVNRFTEKLHPNTRLKNVFLLCDSGRKCKSILDTKIRVAPDLVKEPTYIFILAAIQEVKCPIQRELLMKYYQHTNPKTDWEKMKYSFTLTSNKQRIRKSKKEDCISRVVVPSEMDRFSYVHIEPYLKNYFLFVGSKAEATVAVRLDSRRNESLLEMQDCIEELSTKVTCIDLTI